ncbi:MAG: helix-turn-helix transcriptional regulator [Planctomycetota bacterium]
MAETIAKFERLMNLVAFLLASPEPVPFVRIRKTVIGYNDPAREDAVEKRFDRDKKELREIGIPVEYVASDEQGRDGYYIPREQYFHHELDLTEEEASLLVMLANAARGGGDAISANLRSALLKMAIDSPLQEDVQQEIAQRHLVAFSRGRRDRAALDNLDRLAHAIARRKEVRFRYRRVGERDATVRSVRPYGLGYREGEWYLVGQDTGRKDLRQFKVVRIQGSVQVPKGRARDFEVPAGFDIEEAVDRPPWEYEEGKEEWARVLFHADVAWMAQEALRPGQRFEGRPDGSGVLSLTVRRSPKTHQRLLTWLAAFSGQCAVLQPSWLRRQALDHLTALRRRYA